MGWQLAKELTLLSTELRRQVGVLIDRRGIVAHVILGTYDGLVLPDLKRQRGGHTRLRGMRLVHTHCHGQVLDDDDLADLARLQLDCVAVIPLSGEPLPRRMAIAWINPDPLSRSTTQRSTFARALHEDVNCEFFFEERSLPDDSNDCLERIESLEAELGQRGARTVRQHRGEQALLVHLCDRRSMATSEQLDEMKMLARASGVHIAKVVTYVREKRRANSLLGRGRMIDLSVQALRHDSDLLLFSCDLSPSHINQLAKLTELKIVDRTQLILDIFSRRANSRSGRLQVELAQLQYVLPRLVQKDTAMSRLSGGIGGRGPGETKLEINRRRARQRIAKLENEIDKLSVMRERNRKLRRSRGIPVISLVGYTNVGKSTLLNTLSGSSVHTEDAAFATLDPTCRRIDMADGKQIVALDTVGFIKNLPADLVAAFRATLEEIQTSDLMIHVMDASHDDIFYQMESVERLLADMGYSDIPQIRVLNKCDQSEPTKVKLLSRRLKALPLSATSREGVGELIQHVRERLFSQTSAETERYRVRR